MMYTGPTKLVHCPPLTLPGPIKLSGQIGLLRRAWESSARVTKDDWAEWMRHFSVELLAQSPSPALRACHSLAQVGDSRGRFRWYVGVLLSPALRACCSLAQVEGRGRCMQGRVYG